MLGQRLLRSPVLFFFLFTDAAFLLLKLVKLVCDTGFAHFDSDHLHHFCEVSDISKCSLFVDLSGAKFLIDVLLSRQDELDIVLSHEGERLATSACSGGATHSVHVVFRALGHVEVQHELALWNVQASAGYICRD